MSSRLVKPPQNGIREIAENGDNSFLRDALEPLKNVHEVIATTLPIRRIGGGGPPMSDTSMTVEIEARGSANRLSIATMLICTNDGFTGLDSVKLPGGFRPAVHFANAYDAGTEANDQLYTNIVDPCGGIGPVMVAPDGMNLRTAAAGLITMHPGITGDGDLTAAHQWTNPVAKITVQRLHIDD
jgi:hypothetical protein